MTEKADAGSPAVRKFIASEEEEALRRALKRSKTPPPVKLAETVPSFGDAWRVFVKGFALAFGARAGMSILLRGIALARKGKLKQAISFDQLLSEKNLTFRVEAVQLGLFMGGYSGLHIALKRVLFLLRGRNDKINSLIAGFLAGTTLVIEDAERRRTLALYTMARLAQAGYNWLKSHNYWHFWGSDWAHGDTLLFAISSAQVMYAYVMRPDTLPKSYNSFIVHTGPVHPGVLKAVRCGHRDQPLDIDWLSQFLTKHGHDASKVDMNPKMIPCELLHPAQSSCLRNDVTVWTNAFRRTFALYLSINLVPFIAFNMKKAVTSPLTVLVKGFLGAVRSTSFLSTFVALYQLTICGQRRIVSTDHRFIYWISGAIAGLSLLIERKSRRSELALYVLPRACDSLFMSLNDRKWLAAIPRGEILLFCACMGPLMYLYEHEPENVSGLVKTVFSRFLRIPTPEYKLKRLLEENAAWRKLANESVGKTE